MNRASLLWLAALLLAGCGKGGSRDACADHCDNGVMDCEEAGVDCGGECAACADACEGHCANGVQDCGEAGPDCGGECAACADACEGHCANGVQDCGEAGPDCGGGCAACADACEGHCSNGVQDCGEAGPDCGGGGCPACPDPCEDHCHNGAFDCQETGVDCGGECPACTGADDASVVSHGLPAELPCQAVATVLVTMQNTGSTTWYRSGTQGYKLGYAGDYENPFLPAGASPRVLFDEDQTVAPGEAVTFSAVIVAPTDAGTYTAGFQMVHEGVAWFGQPASASVTVTPDCAPPGDECGEPWPPWEDPRSKIKMSCEGTWCDCTPSCHGCDFCAEIGMPCMPGTGPEPPCTPRCDCPPRPEGHPQRQACETYFFGGDPLWRSDGTTNVKPDNRSLARCEACTWIEVCRADGTMCTRVTF